MVRRELVRLEVEGLPEGWSIHHAPLSDQLAGVFELRRPPTLKKPEGELDHWLGEYTTGFGIEHEWIEQPYSCGEGVSSFEGIDRDQLRARAVLYGLVLEMCPDAMGGA